MVERSRKVRSFFVSMTYATPAYMWHITTSDVGFIQRPETIIRNDSLPLSNTSEVEIIDMATSDNEAGGVSMQSRYVTIATEAIEGWSAGDLPYLSSDHTANEGIQTANWKTEIISTLKAYFET